MRPLTWFLFGVLIVLCIAVSGCKSLPKPPEKVYITVEKFKPLPLWATQPIAKPYASDGSVGAVLGSEFDRGTVIDLMNCHRLLLAKLDAGEPVDPKACASD